MARAGISVIKGVNRVGVTQIANNDIARASAEVRRLLPTEAKGHPVPRPNRRKPPDPSDFEDTCLPDEGYHVEGCGHR